MTTNVLQSIVDASTLRWEQSGLAADHVSQLDTVDIRFAALNGDYLALTTGNTILLDTSAAGYGWYFDTTPQDDTEFDDPTSPVSSRMDLLTVVMHELGHVLGHEDVLDDDLAEDIMFAWLRPGERRSS